jgi:dephospho-CoA kinase
MSTTKLVIGVVGMPGSGKSLVGEVAAAMGFGVVSMGDIIREESQVRGVQPNRENLTRIMYDLREKEGANVVAAKCIPLIMRSMKQVVIVDGLRSVPEIEEFRKSFSRFFVLCVHTSPESRFRRLFGRGRSDDPLHLAEFSDRDSKELQVGIGSAIALADFMLCNEGTIRQFKTKVRRFFRTYAT